VIGEGGSNVRLMDGPDEARCWVSVSGPAARTQTVAADVKVKPQRRKTRVMLITLLVTNARRLSNLQMRGSSKP
jgi:hypothetical protein